MGPGPWTRLRVCMVWTRYSTVYLLSHAGFSRIQNSFRELDLSRTWVLRIHPRGLIDMETQKCRNDVHFFLETFPSVSIIVHQFNK